MELPPDCQRIDGRKEAVRLSQKTSIATKEGIFLVYHDDFLRVLGPRPQLAVICENRDPLFHEAGVYIDGTVYITSNQHDARRSHGDKEIRIHALRNACCPVTQPSAFSAQYQELPANDVPMANGAVNYRDGILFCAQGTCSQPAGLVFVPDPTAEAFNGRYLLDNYHGRPFNSPNDVVVHSDGAIWFTDPIYGAEQGFRKDPTLPNQVYRFAPATGDIRVVADGFGRPNGICFDPAERIAYITDTDFLHGDGSTDPARAATIYAYDIAYPSSSPAAPFLTNRRVFAHAGAGNPDGIKCDIAGNVYSGCGDGVHVWNAGGSLIGKMRVDGGVANLCFGRAGELFLLNEQRCWRALLGPATRGALLGI